MNVLYDGSVAAYCHREKKNKGGVFRVVDSLLKELLKDAEANTKVTSFLNNISTDDITAYLSDLGYSEKQVYTERKNVQDEIQVKEKEVAFLSSSLEQQSFLSRQLAFGTKSKFKKALERLHYLSELPLVEKGRFNIYHSPYYAVPEKIKSDKTIRTFWTSYDLIPILFPQHFEETTINEVKQALDNLNQDSWVLCISQSTRNDLLNYLGKKVDPGKVLVTPLAASENFYQERDKNIIRNVLTKYAVPAETPYILSLCTLEPRKNITQIIKAFSKLVRDEKIKDLNLVLAGASGWKFDAIFEEIETSKDVKNRIYITGFVDDTDQAALYSGARMFVYPTIYEGFGLPPLEAMQCGIPVITSDTSSLPEVVSGAGIMVNPTDLEALTQEMLNLYADQSKCDKLSALSLQKSKEFTWQQTCRQTIESYKMSLL